MLSTMASMRSRLSYEVFLFLSPDHNAFCGIWLQKMLLVQERYSAFLSLRSLCAWKFLQFGRSIRTLNIWFVNHILNECWGSQVVQFSRVSKVGHIVAVLRSTDHNGFPVSFQTSDL